MTGTELAYSSRSGFFSFRSRTAHRRPDVPLDATAAPAPDQPGGVVIVIGRSWLAVFVSLLIVEMLPDGDSLLVVGRPVEATRALAAALVRDGSGRVVLSDQMLAPGDERFVTQLLGARRTRVVVSATDYTEEQHMARGLAAVLGAPVLGASCGGAGWVGPGVPHFCGSPNQRPTMAMRLARTLAAEVRASLGEDDDGR